ncbi:histone acetyltransferase 1 [Fistulifera solaris]|uniref:Histone acetyltransferase 1 n=1 Tax=Fistulifera solaris TaxID=1519565 RepID=A0A1Z5JJJ8_FISSO|nr:histone acetyltransferase 1 [Fistulifera solaris]|eukprot:GAX13968.1 histone acetyltransferase 1 [Fistulifera solaris]
MASAPEIVGDEVTAGASSAARCIELRLLGNTFHPVYTHQLFENETIRGYIPPSNEEAIRNENDEDTALRELKVRIDLSPSCELCRVSLETKCPKKRRLLRSCVTQRYAKRSNAVPSAENVDDSNEEKNDDSDGDESSETVTSEKSASEGSGTSVYVDEDVEEAVNNTKEEGNTRHRRMPLSEVESCLSRALPTIASKAESDIEQKYLTATPGTYLEEYERRGDRFRLTLANGSDAVTYHNEVQRMARFFIETADDVDVADQSVGGTWNILYLFQIHGEKQYSFAGYFTLYHFNSPFRKPTPGTVVRICQALILPPYQRSGHGFTMMNAAYKWAFDGYSKQLKGADAGIAKSIVEINVEDPAPAFVALRNRVDYHRFLEAKAKNENWFGSSADSFQHPDISWPDFFAPLKDSILNEASATAKITSKQVQVVYELLRLHQLQTYSNTAGASNTEALEKRYRLLVKKRLQREYKEDLGACNSKEEMKSLLKELYEQTRRQYEDITRSQSLSTRFLCLG